MITVHKEDLAYNRNGLFLDKIIEISQFTKLIKNSVQIMNNMILRDSWTGE